MFLRLEPRGTNDFKAFCKKLTDKQNGLLEREDRSGQILVLQTRILKTSVWALLPIPLIFVCIIKYLPFETVTTKLS